MTHVKARILASILAAALINAPVILRKHGGPSATLPQQTASLTPADIDRIVNTFTAKETEFRNALAQYSFKRDALFQTFGAGKQISGEYHRTSQLLIDDSGKRYEKMLAFPTPTLSGFGISAEDLDDLGGAPFFALEAAKANLYNFKYIGKERIDDFDLHVFDVSPKTPPDPKKAKERFFQGRIWVDVDDPLIVKTRGKGLPEPKYSAYPTVEIIREEIEKGLWFPTYAYADEELMLGNGGGVVKLRMRVQFSEFKKVVRR
ncbi:MAG TPA: hypothetical protein VGO68_01630 [Pyrinomonadaceae bacterium]|jgi:hypothetical protein|nr:hypothetical protein [Pyrinomonadaceae bacterium]